MRQIQVGTFTFILTGQNREVCVPFESCSSSWVLCVVFSHLRASITSLRPQSPSPLHQFAAPLAKKPACNSNHKTIWIISINCLNVWSLSVKFLFFMFLYQRWWGEMFFTTMFFTLHFPVETFYQYNPFTISSWWFLPTDGCLETFSVVLFEMKVTHPWNIHDQVAAVGRRLTVLLVSISPLCNTHLNFADHTHIRGGRKSCYPGALGELQPPAPHPPSPLDADLALARDMDTAHCGSGFRGCSPKHISIFKNNKKRPVLAISWKPLQF